MPELEAAGKQGRKEAEAIQRGKTMASRHENKTSAADNVNASITIRRHPFSSREARFLVGELDKALAVLYPDWDQLNHPAMQHDHNPHPPDEQTADQASLDFFGQVNGSMEDQEGKGELVFFVAFDGSEESAEDSKPGNGRAIGCAALRLFSTPRRSLPAQLDPSLRYAELKRMFVLPAYRGRGISKLLLRQAEEYAVRQLNIDIIVLETGLRQKVSLRLYEGMGYQQRSMYGEWVGADPASGGDSTCMEKVLK